MKDINRKDNYLTKWNVDRLDKFLTVQNGYAFNSKKFNYKGKGTPLIRIRNLKSGDSDLFFDGEIKPDFIVKKGDFLISMDGEFACYEWKGKDALLNQRVCRLKFYSTELDPKFVFYGINKYLKEIEENTPFVTVKHISSKQIKKINFPNPPISEQKKIVEILDKAFKKIDLAVNLVEKNLKKVSELNESVLSQVFDQNKNWQSATLKDLTLKIGSGSTPRGGRKSYKKSGISFIRSMNVYDNYFESDGLVFIDDEQAKKLSNVVVEKDDVLLNITGASVARSCVVSSEVLPARVNQHVSIIRTDYKILDPYFLNYQLISPSVKKRLLSDAGGGATREAITKKMQEKFIISFPPIEEQKKIVIYINSIRSKNKKLIEHYQNHLKELIELKNSILDYAFKGEFRRYLIQNRETPNKPFYEMQILGLSISANKQDNIVQGEMAIAKDLYLLDRLYGIKTGMNFVNHSWGPFAPEIKKRINNKQYFTRKNFPNSRATYVDVLNQNSLLGKVDLELKKQIFNGIENLNHTLFLKVTKYRRAEIKELLATVLKCIEDSKSVDLKIIRDKMKNWSIKQGKFKTKAEKFSESDTKKMLIFIQKQNWHLKVIE